YRGHPRREGENVSDLPDGSGRGTNHPPGEDPRGSQPVGAGVGSLPGGKAIPKDAEHAGRTGTGELPVERTARALPGMRPAAEGRETMAGASSVKANLWGQ